MIKHSKLFPVNLSETRNATYTLNSFYKQRTISNEPRRCLAIWDFQGYPLLSCCLFFYQIYLVVEVSLTFLITYLSKCTFAFYCYVVYHSCVCEKKCLYWPLTWLYFALFRFCLYVLVCFFSFCFFFTYFVWIFFRLRGWLVA